MTQETQATPSSPLGAVKHRFFAMRNGIVADTLRKSGLPYNTIFGLQLPQLSEIAREIGKDTNLGRMLWEDSEVRESRLLACYLMPPGDVTFDELVEMGESVKTREEADIMAFRLLRYRPDWTWFCDTFDKSERPETRYVSEALRRNMGS